MLRNNYAAINAAPGLKQSCKLNNPPKAQPQASRILSGINHKENITGL